MKYLRHVSLVLAVLTLVLAVAESADAQRRRRRRRAEPVEPPPVEQTPPEEPAEGPPDGQTTPQNEWPEGTSPTEPGQAVPNGQTPTEPGAAPEGATDEALAAEDLSFGPDISPIRTSFSQIMDELVQLRLRTATLGEQLFHTKLRVVVQNRASDDNTLQRIRLTLDGAPVFNAGVGEFAGEDGREVWQGFAAPGPHVIGVEVEQRQRADDEFRYTMRDTYRFTVIRERLTEIEIVLDDDSDIGEDFEDDEEGEFDVRTRFRVATRELGGDD
jgi:hypothetical protein